MIFFFARHWVGVMGMDGLGSVYHLHGMGLAWLFSEQCRYDVLKHCCLPIHTCHVQRKHWDVLVAPSTVSYHTCVLPLKVDTSDLTPTYQASEASVGLRMGKARMAIWVKKRTHSCRASQLIVI